MKEFVFFLGQWLQALNAFNASYSQSQPNAMLQGIKYFWAHLAMQYQGSQGSRAALILVAGLQLVPWTGQTFKMMIFNFGI